MKKYLTLIMLAFLLFVEFLVLRKYRSSEFSERMLLILALLLFIATVVLFLNRKNKSGSVLRVFGGMLSGEVAKSALSITLLLYVLLHVSWISSNIYSALEATSFLVEALANLVFLVFPFSLLPFVIQNKMSEVPSQKRQILVSALSIPPGITKMKSSSDLAAYRLSDEDVRFLSSPRSWQLNCKFLEYYTNVNRILFIRSPQVKKFVQLCNEHSRRLNVIHDFLEKHAARPIEIDFIDIEDADNVNRTFALLKSSIDAHPWIRPLDRKKSDRIIFNVTGSTSALSVQLGYLSLYGLRGAAHVRQDDETIQEIKVDVFTVEDLFDELTDRLND